MNIKNKRAISLYSAKDGSSVYLSTADVAAQTYADFYASFDPKLNLPHQITP